MISDHHHRFSLHVSYRARPIVLLTLAGAFVFISFLAIGYLFNESNAQRHASCRAQEITMQSIEATAVAGIRPVQPLPAGTPPALVESFKRQIAATIAENARRRLVAMRVHKAAVDLARSDFCQ